MSHGAASGRRAPGLAGALARACVGRPGLVAVLVAALAALGLVAAAGVPVDAVPDVTNVQVLVLTRAPGLSPVEVERLVTNGVELGLGGLPGLREVRSTTRAGISSVTAVFDDDVAPERARTLVAERLPGISAALPREAAAPELGPFTTGLGEVFHFTVRWPGHDERALHTLVEYELARPLRRVYGVVEVNLWGGGPRELQVHLDAGRMSARGVTLEAVQRSLERANQSTGAGSVERYGSGVALRGDGLLRSADEVRAVRVRGSGTDAVRVRDVAEVREGTALRTGAATADGAGEVVYVMVQMLAGANARVVVRDVRARLDALRAQLPPGAAVEVFYDRADFVGAVLRTVRNNLLEGALLVVAVLLLALGDAAAALVVAAVIPLSALVAALAVRGLGVTGNLLSLGAVDFGLLVDGAVVVVEHGVALAAAHAAVAPRALARRAVREVARPMSFGVSIIALVYVPVLALEGVEGRMFRPMAQVVLAALLAALALTLTAVPAALPWLVARARRAAERSALRASSTPRGSVRERVGGALRGAYARALGASLARPGLVAALAALACAGAFVRAAALGAEFTPRLEEGQLAVQVTRPPSTSLEEGVRGATELERTLRAFPEVTRVVTRVGSPAVATDLMGPEQSDVFVSLVPPERWRTPYDREALVARMQDALGATLPGSELGFTQPIEMRMAELLSGVRSDVGVRIYGEDLRTLRALGDRVAAVLRGTRGGNDVRVEQVDGLPTLTARPDRDALALHGVDASEALDALRALRAGLPAGRFYEEARAFPLVLRLRPPPGLDALAVGSVLLPREGLAPVPLGALLALREASGPAQVSHLGGRRRIVIEANVRGRDLATYVREARARIEREVPLPRGYALEVDGAFENMTRAASRLAWVTPAALLCVLLLLRASLRRWSGALLVFLEVPAAASGGALALAARGLPLSITAGVGFIALAGIAVLNGLVLLEEIDARRRAGAAPADAAREGALARLRPVCTTAAVAALGFLPMTLARGTGAEVQRPLATVVVGGLCTATLATLLLLPALAARFPAGVQAPRRDARVGGRR